MTNLESLPESQNKGRLTIPNFLHRLREKLRPPVNTEWPRPNITKGSGDPDLDIELTKRFENF